MQRTLSPSRLSFSRSLSESNRVWILAVVASLNAIAMSGCASPGKDTAIGAGAGGLAGAGIGGLIGGGKGALIGAGLGAAAGGVIGNRMDKQAQELAQVAETKRTTDGILVKMKGDLLFETGKSELNAQAKTQLDELAQVLVKYPNNRIQITGYTDNVGSDKKNTDLSFARARAVREVLLQDGVKAEQMQSDGQGKASPVASNATPAGRSQNRRVELKITDVEAEKKAAKASA